MLGHSGVALERDEVGGCRDDVGVGEEYDMEGDIPHRRAQPEGLPKGGSAEQASYAGGRGAPNASR